MFPRVCNPLALKIETVFFSEMSLNVTQYQNPEEHGKNKHVQNCKGPI
jgi:hypothetical protein